MLTVLAIGVNVRPINIAEADSLSLRFGKLTVTGLNFYKNRFLHT